VSDDRAESARDEAARRRRRAEVFGDVLPEATGDDGPGGAGPAGADVESEREEWLRRNVPPHHH
jgi:hypothetical protein